MVFKCLSDAVTRQQKQPQELHKRRTYPPDAFRDISKHRRAYTVPWRRILRQGRGMPRAASQGTRREPQPRKAPAGASKLADTADRRFSPLQSRQCWISTSFVQQVAGFSEFIQHRQGSLASRLRGIWPTPAPEDTNNILARWNKEREAKDNARSSLCACHPLDDQRRYPKVGTVFCAARQSTCHTAPVGSCRGFSRSSWSSLQRSNHPKKNLKRSHLRVTNTLGEQLLSLTHSTGWTTKSSTTYMQWESMEGDSRGLPGGLRKEPTPWNFSNGGVIQAREPYA